MRKLSTVDWASYAQVYDLMADNNPAYQELLLLALMRSSQWPLRQGDVAADIGAGTGNFSLAIARQHPSAFIVHADGDAGMIASARRKAEVAGIGNVRCTQRDAGDLCFAPESLAAAICVHALYAFPQPEDFLRRLRGWLAPGAPVVLCDIGRRVRIGNWAIYLFRAMRRTHGTIGSLEIFLRGHQVAVQNKRIDARQRSGEYWTHSPQEFRSAVEAAGFTVHEQLQCYRGCSDFISAVRKLK